MKGHRITPKPKRELVNAALRAGWVLGSTKGGHFKLVWPATGATLSSGSTGSANSHKDLARDIYRVSGVDLRVKPPRAGGESGRPGRGRASGGASPVGSPAT